MPMTNANMTPSDPKDTKVAVPASANPTPTLTPEQVKEAARIAAQITPNKTQDEEAALLAGASAEFEDQVSLEEKKAKELLAKEEEKQTEGAGKSISDLIEADAYDLAIPINAGAMYNPDLLKVVLLDKNYICRWGNRNSIRQAMLASQGFRPISIDEVENTDTLEMFEDSEGHLVYADLIAMKCLKSWYYAGLRRAYLKSKYATNDRKAAEAGAAFAQEKFIGQLQGSERGYMSQHSGKPIYKPNIGV